MNRLKYNRSMLKNRMENSENAILESFGLAAVNGVARGIKWLFTPDKKEQKKNVQDDRQEIRIVSSDEYDNIRRSILSGEGEKETDAHDLAKRERNNTAIFISGLSIAVGFIAIKRMQKKGRFKRLKQNNLVNPS